MKPVQPWRLLSLCLIIGMLSTLLTAHWVMSGGSLSYTGVEFALGALLAAVATGYFGIQVRRLKLGEPTWLGAVGAARVAALALALSHLGVIFLGYFGGQIVFLLGNLPNEALRGFLLTKAIAGIGAVLMLVTGLVVARICTIDPPDQGRNSHSGTAPAPA